MKNLGKKRIKTLGELQAKYAYAREELQSALETAKTEVEAAVAKANDDLTLKVAAINEVIGEINSFREEVSSDIESFMDEKSDNWRDGERGSAYSEWKDAWDNEIQEVADPDLSYDLFSSFEDSFEESPETVLDDGDYPAEPSL